MEKVKKRTSYGWMWLVFIGILIYDNTINEGWTYAEGTGVIILTIQFIITKFRNKLVKVQEVRNNILRYNNEGEAGGIFLILFTGYIAIVGRLEMLEKFELADKLIDGIVFVIIACVVIALLYNGRIHSDDKDILKAKIKKSRYNETIGSGIEIITGGVYEKLGSKHMALLEKGSREYKGGFNLPKDIIDEEKKNLSFTLNIYEKGMLIKLRSGDLVDINISIPNELISTLKIDDVREYKKTVGSGKDERLVEYSDVNIILELKDGRAVDFGIIGLKSMAYVEELYDLQKYAGEEYDIISNKLEELGKQESGFEELREIIEEEKRAISGDDTNDEEELNDSSKEEAINAIKRFAEEEVQKAISESNISSEPESKQEDNAKAERKGREEEELYNSYIKNGTHIYTEKFEHPLKAFGFRPLYGLSKKEKMNSMLNRGLVYIFTLIAFLLGAVWSLEKIVTYAERLVDPDIALVIIIMLVALMALVFFIGTPVSLLFRLSRECRQYRKKKKYKFNEAVDIHVNEGDSMIAHRKEAFLSLVNEVYQVMPKEDRVVALSAVANYKVKNYPITLERLESLYTKLDVDEKINNDYYLKSIYAECLIRCRRLDDALDMISTFKNIEGLKLVSETLRAEALMNKGREEDAITIVEDMFEIYGDKGARAHMLKYVQGKAYYRLGEHQKALDLLREVYRENDRFEDVSVLIENIECDINNGNLLA